MMKNHFTSPPNREDFQISVWEIVRQIPAGKVMTYGQIAAMFPPPENMTAKGYKAFGPRWVGGAMAACPDGLPWQRVVNSRGRISQQSNAEKQRDLLIDEGIEFDESDCIDLKRFLFVM
jgi:methylated-DNA-protein-cysteine methyltransferase-like protein